jgi:hypothetical protein
MHGTRLTQSRAGKPDIPKWRSQKNTSDWRSMLHIWRTMKPMLGASGEDQVNILIERNRNLLGQAEGARQKTQRLKVEHHLIALRALEARPLAHSNRSYRRIARGEQDPLVLVRRTPRARRRYTSSQARKEANLASELGQRASELKLST